MSPADAGKAWLALADELVASPLLKNLSSSAVGLMQEAFLAGFKAGLEAGQAAAQAHFAGYEGGKPEGGGPPRK